MTQSTGPRLIIVIPALNAGAGLTKTLLSLGKSPDGFSVILADGGSDDDTTARARDWGAVVIDVEKGRGQQLAAGAKAAEAGPDDWLLFLHADTTLETDWLDVCQTFMAHPANKNRAGYGRFSLDGPDSFLKKLMAKGVAWRSKAMGWPFGDQGLLIRYGFYTDIGGYRPLDLFEDVDLVRAIGKKRLSPLPFTATTSAAHYEKDGYLIRISRNIALQVCYRLGIPPGKLNGIYKGSHK